MEARLATGIDDEIALIWVIIRRLVEESKKEGKAQAKDLFDLLERVSLGAARLAAIVRTQFVISGGKNSDTVDTIKQALIELNKDMSLKI